MTLTRYLFPCDLAAVLSLPVNADEQAIMEMDLEQLLQVSITGATLREESIKTVPSPTTLFTREQLDDLGLDYLHELLALVPGLQTNRGADIPINYSFSIRGRRQGARAVEVLLLVDGREFSDPRSGGADSALYLFPLANIERVEIIRGPASAIYGSGAFTGVINIISRTGANGVSLGAGEPGRRKADINLAYTTGDWHTNFYTHLAEDDGELYRLGDVTTRDPRREQVIDWNIGFRQTKVRAFASRMEGEDFYSLEKINNDINYYRQESQHIRIEQGFTPSEAWKGTVSVNYQKASQSLHGEVIPRGALSELSTPASDEPMLAKARLAGEAYRFLIANDLVIAPDLSVQVGGELTHERETLARTRTTYDLEQLANRSYPISYYGNFEHEFAVGSESSRNLGGAYAQLLYNLNDATRLVGGLRYDRYESMDGYASPRLGLTHQLTSHQTVKILYGEAFRTPGFAETGILNNPVLVGNPELDNEAVKTLEFMWMGAWRNISIGATTYHNYYQKPIETGLINNVRTYVNGENQKNYGVGLRIDWQLNPRWMLRANYNSLRNLPEAYFREADQTSSFIVNYQGGKWNWNLSAVNNGTREYLLSTTTRAKLESYWIANSQLRYQLNRTTSLSLAAKNLFDKEFFTPPQGTGLVGGVPNRGREASLVWQWEWK